ncbi:MAG: efflux RND transporter permease subunit [Verrucomicrobiia bacterium]
MNSLATFYVRNGHLLALTCLVSLAAGAAALQSLPRLEDPVITNRNPSVITPYPGATAERVEALVSEPIERTLREVDRIKKIESTSRAGISVVAIELEDSVDRNTNGRIFSEIRDKLEDTALPPGAGKPFFDEKRRAVATTLLVGLGWEPGHDAPPGVLARAAEELAERLRGVRGTDIVRTYGAPEEEILVEVDGDALASLGLPVNAVAESLARADAKVPSGIIREPRFETPLEFDGELDSAARIAAVPIRADGGRAGVRVGDVAAVRRTSADPAPVEARVAGAEGVLVAARVREGERVDAWAESARRVLRGFGRDFPPPLIVDVVFDQNRYTSARLADLTVNLALAVVVVCGIIFVIMGWRAALVIGSAIPLTAGLTLFVVASSGGALHQMSIFGMIVALGILIDNAIVITDEVRHHIDTGADRIDAVGRAVRHLAVPLLASTLTTMLAFLPIMLLPGNAGDFVSSIGGSVVVALGCSLFVALTVTAALAGRFLVSAPSKREARPLAYGFTFSAVARVSRALLNLAVRKPALGMAVASAVPLLGFLLAPTLGSQFFPRTDRDMFEIKLWLAPGSAIGATAEAVAKADAILRGFPGFVRSDWVIGESHPPVYYNQIVGEDGSPHFAQSTVTVSDAGASRAAVRALQAELSAAIPEAQVLVANFAQGPPAAADVEFRLTGPSIDALRTLGAEIRRVLSDHPEIVLTRASLPGGEPKWKFRLEEDSALQAGFQPTALAAQIAAQLDGAVAANVLEGVEQVPVRVRLCATQREGADGLRETVLPGREIGSMVPLDALGTLDLVPEAAAVTRRNAERVNRIFGYSRPGSLPIEIVHDVVTALDASGFSPPPGYRLEVGGDAENQNEALGNLALYLPLIVLATVATLILSFRSVWMAGLLLVAAGLSAGYGLFATWIWDLPLSFNTIIGSIGLVGLAFNSSIVVLASVHADRDAADGDPDAICRAVARTGRHLAATTLTTIGSFLPLLVFVGGQFWPPLAVVLAGGVGGSTLLAWLFTPAAYLLIRKATGKKHSALPTASS